MHCCRRAQSSLASVTYTGDAKVIPACMGHLQTYGGNVAYGKPIILAKWFLMARAYVPVSIRERIDLKILSY